MCCKQSDAQPQCKSFGECAKGGNCASRLARVEKPCVRAWLAKQSVLPAKMQADLEAEYQSEESEPSYIMQLRKIVKTDSSLWLSETRTDEELPTREERIFQKFDAPRTTWPEQ